MQRESGTGTPAAWHAPGFGLWYHYPMVKPSLKASLLMSAIGLLLATTTSSAQTPTQPVAPVRPVTDTYFGHKVVDPYRWMENLKDPQTLAWIKGQAVFARSVLDGIPGRQALLAEIKKLDKSGESVSDVSIGGSRYFYLKTPAAADNSQLYVRDGLRGQERLLVDPATLTRNGVHYSIDYIAPSLDGRYIAYGLSPGGSEDSVIHVIDVHSGRELGEHIDRAEYGGVNWRSDGRSFFYIRLQKLPPGAPDIDKYQKNRVYLHVLGTDPDKDSAVFGYDLSPRVAITVDDDPEVYVTPASPYILGVVAHGVLPEQTIYAAPIGAYAGADTPWHKIADVPDDVTSFDARGDTIYLVTHKNASRFKVISTRIDKPDLAHANVVVPAGEAVIRAIAVAGDALYVQSMDGGIGLLSRIPFSTARATSDRGMGVPARHPQSIPLLYSGAIDGLVTFPTQPGAIFLETGWTHSALWYIYDPATKRVADTGMKRLSPVSFAGITSVEVKARAADGVLIPLSIIYRKDMVRDGTHPLLMQAYGAYGISLDPYFDPEGLPWLNRGGILATAHVRGGGEYGEDWHQAGRKRTKPNTWNDLIACAQYLIEQKYTSADRLAIEGGSAGGITVGRALTERPDLFGAVIDDVGVSDALRSELEPNGPPNIPEFGSFKTPDGFRDLDAMDAYLHVKDGVKYPAVLLLTGINDPRVAPWEPAKMAARLQAATTSGKPIILRVDYDAGHGIGSTKAQDDAQLADIYAFLFQQFGVTGFQTAPSPPDTR